MTNVYLKHDSVAVLSEVGLNGYFVQEPSKFLTYARVPFRDWVDFLIPTLKEETHDVEFQIDFYGSAQDYNLLANSINAYCGSNNDVRIAVNFYQVEPVAPQPQQSFPPQQPAMSAEDAAERTYKGFLFDSVQVKEAMEQADKELEAFCAELDAKTYEELWEKKEFVSRLPQTVFASYFNAIISALPKKADADKIAYQEQIENSDMEALQVIHGQLLNSHYPSQIKDVLLGDLNRKLCKEQKLILEDMVRSLDLYDVNMCRDLLVEISRKGFDEEVTSEFKLRINRKIDLIESKELEELCANMNEKTIEQLEAILETIKEKQYQERLSISYVSKIHQTMESIHVRNLEAYCGNIDQADAVELKTIRENVDYENCRNELKTRFYAKINERQDKLDLELLKSLTENVESQSLEELEALYQKLTSGSFNQRYVKEYVVKVLGNLEKARYQKVKDLCDTVDNLSKEEVEALKQQILGMGYPNRITKVFVDRMEERLYELDMQMLETIQDNFDSLSLTDIESLRARLSGLSISPRSLNTYEKKLNEREYAIGYEMISPMAAFAKQTIDQTGLSTANVHAAVYSPDFAMYLGKFAQLVGSLDYSDFPAVIAPDFGFMALTKRFLYFNTQNGYVKVNVGDFRTFTIEKKLLSENVSVCLMNGAVIPVSLSGRKNTEQIANYLMVMIQNVGNEAMFSRFTPYTTHVSNFSEVPEQGKRQLPDAVTEQTIQNILLFQYSGFTATYGAIQNLNCAYQDNWIALVNKLKAGYGINTDVQFAMYYDPTLFGSAKEGFAVGQKFLYVKKNGQNLIMIPYKDIYEVSNWQGQVSVVTTLNNVISLGLPNAAEEAKVSFAKLLDEYVKGIQMMNTIDPSTVPENSSLLAGNGNMPAFGQPQPAFGQPQPAFGQAQPAFGQPQSAFGQPQSAFGQSQSAFGQPAMQPQNAVLEQGDMKCVNCGNQLKQGMKFCNKCGTRIM